MKILIYAIFFLTIFAACSSSEAVDDVKNEVAINELVPNKVLTLQVEGMACEMACGGEIRKNIKKMAGVIRVEVDFDEDSKVDGVNIYYDDTNADTDGMIKLIEQLNNGQFKVHKSDISNFTPKQESTQSESANSSEHGISASSEASSFEIPNILDLLSELIVN